MDSSTLIQYARFHSLALNHRAAHLLFSLVPPPPANHLQASDPEDVPHVELPASFTVDEKLSCPPDTGRLLGECCRWPLQLDDEAWEDALARKKRPWHMKVELPILRTDHERDMRSFGGKIEPDLTNLNIPLEMLDEESDEGLQWPLADSESSKRLEGFLGSERPVFSKEGFRELGAVIKGYGDVGDIEEALDNEKSRYKKIEFEPTTPPLLPLEPELEPEPYLPSSEVGHLELLSEHTSPTEAECEELTELLMKKDGLIQSDKEEWGNGPAPSDMEIDDPFERFPRTPSPLRSLELPFSPLRKHIPISSIIVEGPLTPPPSLPVPGSSTKRVFFPLNLKDMVTDIPPASKDPGHSESSELEFEAFINDTIAPMAEKVNRKLAQEQLQEADSTKRLEVPTMDFSLGKPPWEVYWSSAGISGDIVSRQMRLVQKIKETYGRDSRWPGSRRIENELNWVPFPVEFGKVALREKIEDDGSLANYFAGISLADSVDLDSQTWKPDGLLILKDDDDEELEDWSSQRGILYLPADLASPVHKRKTVGNDLNDDSKGKRIKGSTLAHRAAQTSPHEQLSKAPRETKDSLLLGGFSAGSSLEMFMRLRGVALENLKQKKESAPIKSAGKGRANSPVMQQELGPHREVLETEDINTTAQPSKKQNSLPAPSLDLPSGPKPFVISSTLLPHRRLLRLIQDLYPVAILVERDFKLHQPSITPGIPAQGQTRTSDLTDEPDILLSPSTGLIWTTLQKIKQRPLPGQGRIQCSCLQDRISKVAKRYEQLIVLVSEGLTDNAGRSQGLDEKDSDALVELMAFAAASTGDEISVVFVGGGEEELARWIVGLMGRYGSLGGEKQVELLQDETLWEIFLRRAGMNAFAAQVVLSLLKKQDDEITKEGGSPKEPEPFGLVAFVEMAHKERLQRFERVLGGRKLLDKMHATVDTRWQ